MGSSGAICVGFGAISIEIASSPMQVAPDLPNSLQTKSKICIQVDKTLRLWGWARGPQLYIIAYLLHQQPGHEFSKQMSAQFCLFFHRFVQGGGRWMAGAPHSTPTLTINPKLAFLVLRKLKRNGMVGGSLGNRIWQPTS